MILGVRDLEISQVILGVRDLEAVAARIAALGFAVIDGGRHPGIGTANRIVPLGRQYFELLGVVDPAEAAANEYGRALLDRTAGGDRLVRWSLRTPDIDAVAARLGLHPEARSRVRPDGVRLTWRAAGLDLAWREPWLPFFMQWDDPAHYPGLLPAAHPNGATGVARLDLTPADPDRLARWTEGAAAPIRILPAPPGLHHVAIATPGGEIVLP